MDELMWALSAPPPRGMEMSKFLNGLVASGEGQGSYAPVAIRLHRSVRAREAAQSCPCRGCPFVAVSVAVVFSHSVVSYLCNPMYCNPPGFSVPGISQARKLQWVFIFLCRGSSQPRDRTRVCFTTELPGKSSYLCKPSLK